VILTDQHQSPPRLVNAGDGTVSSAAVIKQGDVGRLAELGLYRHESEGSGPHDDWALASDAEGPLYTRQTRALTAAELDAAREQKRNELYRRRVQAEKADFTHSDGRQYDGGDDTLHRLSVVARQITLALMAGTPDDTVVVQGGWRDVNDVGGPSTIAELQALLDSHYQHGVACEANSQTLKAAINAAATAADLDAIDLEAGWP